MDLKTLCEEIHETARSKGWWDPEYPTTFVERMALVGCEVSEAIEEYRTTGSVTAEAATELADVVIRCLDMAVGYVGADEFLRLMRAKMDKNKGRPYRHGGKFA